MSATAQCLCGAVTVEAAQCATHVGACHCSMCRQWGGGPYLAVDCGSDVTFGGEENIERYQSSDWAERGFCRKCGTHLFYHLKEPSKYIMTAGLFGDLEGATFDHQIFIDEKPAWYDFANATKNMTGEEVFAMFNAGSDD